MLTLASACAVHTWLLTTYNHPWNIGALVSWGIGALKNKLGENGALVYWCIGVLEYIVTLKNKLGEN